MNLESREAVVHSAAIQSWIEAGQAAVQQFWDQWYQQPIEQYVACDFRDVADSLQSLVDRKLIDGQTFCEWGCGFGIVTGIASLLGFEAIGIEAEAFLVEKGRSLLDKHGLAAELWHGNFLPPGAESLAEQQSNHASMFHQVRSAYEHQDLQVDDFALIFAYPWPGEERFIQDVFETYARPDAVLLLFRGPYQLEVYRKVLRKK